MAAIKRFCGLAHIDGRATSWPVPDPPEDNRLQDFHRPTARFQFNDTQNITRNNGMAATDNDQAI